MNPLVWIGVALVLAVVVAVTGFGPKGGKPVARTRLMKTARLFLLVGIVVCGVLALAAGLRR